jgi:hypothetical protein
MTGKVWLYEKWEKGKGVTERWTEDARMTDTMPTPIPGEVWESLRGRSKGVCITVQKVENGRVYFIGRNNRMTSCSIENFFSKYHGYRFTGENRPLANSFKNEGDYVAMSLLNGCVCKIDSCDVSAVSQHLWYSFPRQGSRRGVIYEYPGFIVCARIDKSTAYLHRFLLGAKGSQIVDHVNGDTLDNRKSNLRLCDASQNAANSQIQRNNTSGYKGVSFYQQKPSWTPKWKAQISENGKRTNLGLFDCPIDAARVYDQAARAKWGEFACVNFPKENEQSAMRRKWEQNK